ncbi:flavin reductase family protein [Sphaerisporangium sp. B11E5]|uniref:flavin reductase family protein n=1 Tax=Sphaerisporangium sp. B11E5 TaxID=3153563 RepID=UPI00325DC0B3
MNAEAREQVLTPRVQEQAGAAQMRDFMTTFPTGVAVVTALDLHDRPWGMTCTSLCSVTVEPPTLLVCLRDGGPTLRAVLDRQAFAVNLIRQDSRHTAQLFASGRADRFQHIPWMLDADAARPHLDSAHAHSVADCRVVRADLLHDHWIVYGELIRISADTAAPPLLYGYRRYGHFD